MGRARRAGRAPPSHLAFGCLHPPPGAPAISLSSPPLRRRRRPAPARALRAETKHSAGLALHQSLSPPTRRASSLSPPSPSPLSSAAEMSPLIDDHQQRSPLLPVIKQHLALPDVGSGPPELALPLQIVKSDQGGSLLEGPLCASAREPERMPFTDSLADRAEEYGVLGKPPPYPEGGSADDTASPFSYPPSAPTQHLVVPMQLAVPPFAPSPPPPLLATSAAKSLAAETEAAQSAIQAPACMRAASPAPLSLPGPPRPSISDSGAAAAAAVTTHVAQLRPRCIALPPPSPSNAHCSASSAVGFLRKTSTSDSSCAGDATGAALASAGRALARPRALSARRHVECGASSSLARLEARQQAPTPPPTPSPSPTSPP